MTPRPLSLVLLLWTALVAACGSSTAPEPPEGEVGGTCASYGTECACPDGTVGCAPHSGGGCDCGGTEAPAGAEPAREDPWAGEVGGDCESVGNCDEEIAPPAEQP